MQPTVEDFTTQEYLQSEQKYNKFVELLNRQETSKVYYASQIYTTLLKAYNLTPEELPFNQEEDKTFYCTPFELESSDLVENDKVIEEKPIYAINYDQGNRELGTIGFQKAFELAQSFGDSSRKFQTRYLFITWGIVDGELRPLRLHSIKIADPDRVSSNLDLADRYTDTMQKLASEKPTKVTILKTIKLRD